MVHGPADLLPGRRAGSKSPPGARHGVSAGPATTDDPAGAVQRGAWPALTRFAKIRQAPGTPAGNCRNHE